MALIPPDAGIRMRMQTDATLLQPVQPTHEIPSDLPELQPGQAFAARILATLPDNTYKALVAGKLLTLQLPEGANPGDSLELVVVDRTTRSITAQRVDTQATGQPASQPYENARLSNAGQLIGRLLLQEGESPQPAPLNRGQPLLAQPPATTADLAPTLARAVSQSGLFYEAHQAEWVAGQRPVESLAAEPHARFATPANDSTQTARTATIDSFAKPVLEAPVQAKAETPSQPTVSAAGGERGAQSTNTQSSGTTSSPPLSVPDQLRPIVQQQLDAVATQRLVWHGEVWPGQVIDWEIERERTDDRETQGDRSEAERWNTTLRLTMPHLGTVDAALQISGNTLRLRLVTGNDSAAADLRNSSGDLARALADAGVAVQSIEVKNAP